VIVDLRLFDFRFSVEKPAVQVFNQQSKIINQQFQECYPS